MEQKIKEIIEKIRPYVHMHGGDVELESIEDGVVKLNVSGHCAHCHLAHMTYNEMLGGIIKQEVPEIKDVVISE